MSSLPSGLREISARTLTQLAFSFLLLAILTVVGHDTKAVADPVLASEDDEQLATQLANPLADLISIPFQGNYNQGIGPLGDGRAVSVNVQPVIPFSINDNWNVISRTITPVVWQDDIFPTAGTQFGLGNTVQSLFLSPSRPTNGFLWGAGPVFLIPTHTDELLGLDTFAAGPTAVGLWQGNGWTVGMLANHLWSVAGDTDETVNATFLQPFIAYTTADAWTFSLNTESTYDWNDEQWNVPVNANISKLVKIGGKLPVSFFGGVRYWVEIAGEHGARQFGRAPRFHSPSAARHVMLRGPTTLPVCPTSGTLP